MVSTKIGRLVTAFTLTLSCRYCCTARTFLGVVGPQTTGHHADFAKVGEFCYTLPPDSRGTLQTELRRLLTEKDGFEKPIILKTAIVQPEGKLLNNEAPRVDLSSAEPESRATLVAPASNRGAAPIQIRGSDLDNDVVSGKMQEYPNPKSVCAALSNAAHVIEDVALLGNISSYELRLWVSPAVSNKDVAFYILRCESAEAPQAHYEISAVNPGGLFKRHFSCEEQGTLEYHCVLAVLVGLAGYVLYVQLGKSLIQSYKQIERQPSANAVTLECYLLAVLSFGASVVLSLFNVLAYAIEGRLLASLTILNTFCHVAFTTAAVLANYHLAGTSRNTAYQRVSEDSEVTGANASESPKCNRIRELPERLKHALPGLQEFRLAPVKAVFNFVTFAFWLMALPEFVFSLFTASAFVAATTIGVFRTVDIVSIAPQWPLINTFSSRLRPAATGFSVLFVQGLLDSHLVARLLVGVYFLQRWLRSHYLQSRESWRSFSADAARGSLLERFTKVVRFITTSPAAQLNVIAWLIYPAIVNCLYRREQYHSKSASAVYALLVVLMLFSQGKILANSERESLSGHSGLSESTTILSTDDNEPEPQLIDLMRMPNIPTTYTTMM